MGFVFTGNTTDGILVKIKENQKENQYEFKRLNMFEFNSTRKRMSIIIEDNGFYKMYVKGADNVIKDRLLSNFTHPFLDFSN